MKENLAQVVKVAVEEAQKAAAKATNDFLAKHGEAHFNCGFAWVVVSEKGSTKMGRALTANGFQKSYHGGLEWWNPSGNYTQDMTAKEVGAFEAARELSRILGVKAYCGSRLD